MSCIYKVFLLPKRGHRRHYKKNNKSHSKSSSSSTPLSELIENRQWSLVKKELGKCTITTATADTTKSACSHISDAEEGGGVGGGGGVGVGGLLAQLQHSDNHNHNPNFQNNAPLKHLVTRSSTTSTLSGTQHMKMLTTDDNNTPAAVLSNNHHHNHNNPNHETILHTICKHQPPLDIVKLLHEKYPHFLSTPTHPERLCPIHIACMYGAHPHVISYLVNECPSAANATSVDSEGRTSLHMICAGYTEYYRNVSMITNSISSLEDGEDPSIGRRNKWHVTEDSGVHGGGINNNSTSSSGTSSLTAKDAMLKSIRTLTRKFPDIVDVHDNEDMTALEYAICGDTHIDIVKSLQRATERYMRAERKRQKAREVIPDVATTTTTTTTTEGGNMNPTDATTTTTLLDIHEKTTLLNITAAPEQQEDPQGNRIIPSEELSDETK